ncbi:hypothetical protein [Paenalcaligenes faecalis]|uniref:hypothetical protein n=1 Tax=Paenalcaligenes faecalis TaxID=2980099 RepID=UPI0022B96184|nr:hypothetical protein [Paenalcaligenes faecalis]
MSEESNLQTDVLSSLMTSNQALQDAVLKIARIQQATTRATFEALNQEQKSTFCKSLESSGAKPKDIQQLTNRSQSTISRLLK